MILQGMRQTLAGRQSGGKCISQMGFSAVESAGKKKQTRRERFLGQIVAAPASMISKTWSAHDAARAILEPSRGFSAAHASPV